MPFSNGGQLLRGTIDVQPMEVRGKNRSMLPLGHMRATLIEPVSLSLAGTYLVEVIL